MPDNTTKALSALVAFLQTKMNDPELDEIDVLLNGPIDPDTGGATGAMDRRIRRQVAQHRVATDASHREAFTERFPNANRLAR